MTPRARCRKLACIVLITLLQGCKDEPNPRAVKVTNDPRLKRVDMSAFTPAISVK